MFEALSKYAVFSGRSRRKEFWLFILLNMIVSISAISLDALLNTEFIALISTLALIVPSFAVTVRRFHDLDKSGWWCLIQFVPLIGGIALIIFMCIDGTQGVNRFGPDPKAHERDAITA